MTARDLITEACKDVGILAAGESLRPEVADTGIGHLARIFDNWNAQREAVFADRFTNYTLIPSLQPHTIGPAGSGATFVSLVERPVSIDGAWLILTNVSPAIYRKIDIRDSEWWGALPVPTLSTAIPTDLYYSADWPLGQIYLWPVPNVAYGIRLLTRVPIAALALDDTMTMPPGYRDAATRTVGEAVAQTYNVPLPDGYAGLAREARARVYANNDVLPRLRTMDAGMPRAGSGSPRGTWNYRTGGV